MKVGEQHLTYCSNIHAGESWASVRDTLGSVLPELRTRLAWSGPMGIGLRLSASAAEALEDPPAPGEFLRFLADGQYYVFTINGFPYGAFHHTRVKEHVYEPDWRDPRRLAYTNRLAGLLAHLTEGVDIASPSVSTVPGAFRALVQDDRARGEVADGFLRHAAYLVDLRRRTGRVITLAIEPEPACQLETTGEVIEFLTRWVCDRERIAAIAREAGLALTVEDVRAHLGVCLDTCHLAVAHEDPVAALDAIEAAGIRVHKVQVSSALSVEAPQAAESLAALERFADDTYLHQVVEHGAELTRFTDLPDALAAARRQEAGHGPWRVHFHVPVFLEALGPFLTTQRHLQTTVREVLRRRLCSQFEVETYTWDVLPPEHRTSGLVPAIARELAWTRTLLESAGER
jgi:sugar phosphate isomerase/epimerase